MSDATTRPAVSLLVPVFNREGLLSDCLESGLGQTMSDIEIVVVDGASTDGTWDVCRRFAARDPRVRPFRDPTNTGPVRGWWSCVEKARGRYATFLWSDDVVFPSFLERTLPFLADERVAFAYTAAEIGPSPGHGRVAYALADSQTMTSDEFIVGSLTSRGRFPVSPACALFRLEDIRRNFLTDVPEPKTDLTLTGAGVDLMFYLLTARQRPDVVHISEPLAFFRSHPGSISTEGRAGEVDRHYALAKSWFAKDYGRPDLIPTILAWHWLARMRDSGRAMSPRAAVQRYGGLTNQVRLVSAAMRIAASLVIGAVSSRLRHQPSPK